MFNPLYDARNGFEVTFIRLTRLQAAFALVRSAALVVIVVTIRILPPLFLFFSIHAVKGFCF